MKNFNFKNWTYKGQKMVGLHILLRRFVGLGIVWLGKAVFFLGCVLGWGLEDAKHHWRQLP